MSANLAELKRAMLVNTLRSCQLFTGVPLPDLETIAGFTAIRPLEKGEYLFREGDVAHGFYVVQKGAINVHRVSVVGREQVIHVFRPGESFAEAALATALGYPADARAVEPSQVLLVQKLGFIDLLKQRPELALRMFASMSVHLRVLVGQLEDLTLKDVETRLANWLVKHCPDPRATRPASIQLGVAKRVLAAEIGTVSETLSRTLAKFREQGLISVKGKTITVTSPAQMAAWLERLLAGRN